MQRPALRSRWLPRRWLGAVAALTVEAEVEAEAFTAEAVAEGFTREVVADFAAVQ